MNGARSFAACPLLIVALLASACGGAAATTTQPKMSDKQVSGVAADDASRCDYKGRADREVNEVRGPGAQQPNIRRVYSIVGEGEDRKKILLCREVDTNLDGAKDVMRTYTDKGEPLNELADTNFDGKVDTWITFARGRIAKVQLDKAGRGQPDEVKFYVGGKLARAQRDTNKDGKPDQWEIYDEGRLQRLGVDLDFDGRVDRWDRDELALRDIEAREKAEEQKARDAEEAKKKQDEADGKPVEGHVSPRER
ncbi:MAG: hypothetical protein EOO73_26155 [Myxococcales bacterium]|nr:MAG: hypothetical protein EOO73_26155 [Myxococcales bacterium]